MLNIIPLVMGFLFLYMSYLSFTSKVMIYEDEFRKRHIIIVILGGISGLIVLGLINFLTIDSFLKFILAFQNTVVLKNRMSRSFLPLGEYYGIIFLFYQLSGCLFNIGLLIQFVRGAYTGIKSRHHEERLEFGEKEVSSLTIIERLLIVILLASSLYFIAFQMPQIFPQVNQDIFKTIYLIGGFVSVVILALLWQ